MKIERFEVISSQSDIKEVSSKVVELLQRQKLNHGLIFDIRVSLEEALRNAILHGNKLDQSKKVKIEYMLDNSKFEATIQDEGDGFDWRLIPDPTESKNILKNSGRGIYLIRRLMNEVVYSDRGNSIKIVKYISQTAN